MSMSSWFEILMSDVRVLLYWDSAGCDRASPWGTIIWARIQNVCLHPLPDCFTGFPNVPGNFDKKNTNFLCEIFRGKRIVENKARWKQTLMPWKICFIPLRLMSNYTRRVALKVIPPLNLFRSWGGKFPGSWEWLAIARRRRESAGNGAYRPPPRAPHCV